MSSNSNLKTWLKDNLSGMLPYIVSPDIIDYITSIADERDLEDYFRTMLDFKNPKHKAFVDKYKVIRHSEDPRKKNDKNDFFKSKEDIREKKKEVITDAIKEDSKGNIENQELEPPKGEGRKKKSKFVNLYSAEGQNKDVIFLKGRHVCECQASKHKLINNCLKCGRVVCAQEGSGPCLYCGTLVCSVEEQNIINSNTKQSEKLYNTLMNSKPDELEKALEQRNRLLEYDKTIQQRSRVIDDESDYYSSTSNWLTKEERDKILKKEQEVHAKKHASRLDRKITLDFAGRQVIEEIPDDEMDENFFREVFDKIEESLAESHAHPDFPATIQPIFISDKESTDYPALNNKSFSNKNINYKVQDKELLLISDSGACLSMHQPWASLLVAGIKKHEGRTWYTSHRGRLWIAAASKTPTEDNIKECEAFYRMYYGDDEIKFPTSYPTSCLLGCVSLIECLPQEEYRAKYPNGESESPFVFICEDFTELDIRFPMSGSHKIYKLDNRIHQAAKKALLRIAKQSKSQS